MSCALRREPITCQAPETRPPSRYGAGSWADRSCSSLAPRSLQTPKVSPSRQCPHRSPRAAASSARGERSPSASGGSCVGRGTSWACNAPSGWAQTLRADKAVSPGPTADGGKAGLVLWGQATPLLSSSRPLQTGCEGITAGGRRCYPQGLTCLPQWKMLWGVKRSAGDGGQEGAEHRRGRALRIQRLQRPTGRSHLVRDLSQLAATCHPCYTLQRKGGPRGIALPGRVLALLPVARKARPVHYHKHL